MTLNTNRFRSWLLLLARTRVGGALRGKVDPSDVVQQTLMLATRDADQYRGSSDAELAGWLRGILGNVLAHEWQGMTAAKRDISREVPIQTLLEESSRRLDDLLAASQTSPSQAAVNHEEQFRLASALEELPADYRDVLVLKHMEGLSFPEIAEQMDRNAGAVRMLWVRALARLKQSLEASRGNSTASTDSAV